MDARLVRFGCLALAVGLVVLFLGAAGAPQARADEGRGPAYRCVDPSLVYLGNPRLFRKPCAVSADLVYRAIPEYQEILDKNLTDRDVRYHFLMRKASEKFMAAVRETAQEGAYDLVAGLGAVVPEGDTPAVPDETHLCIRKLPS